MDGMKIERCEDRAAIQEKFIEKLNSSPEMTDELKWKPINTEDNGVDGFLIMTNAKKTYILKAFQYQISCQKEFDMLQKLKVFEDEGDKETMTHFLVPKTINNIEIIHEEELKDIYYFELPHGGTSLFAHARVKNKVVKSQIVDIYSTVLRVLKKMHEKRIYHCDLHYGNVLCDDTGNNVKIIDFGRSFYINDQDEVQPSIHTKINFGKKSIEEIEKESQGNDLFMVGKAILNLWFLFNDVNPPDMWRMTNLPYNYINFVREKIESLGENNIEDQKLLMLSAQCMMSTSVSDVLEKIPNIRNNEKQDMTSVETWIKENPIPLFFLTDSRRRGYCQKYERGSTKNTMFFTDARIKKRPSIRKSHEALATLPDPQPMHNPPHEPLPPALQNYMENTLKPNGWVQLTKGMYGDLIVKENLPNDQKPKIMKIFLSEKDSEKEFQIALEIGNVLMRTGNEEFKQYFAIPYGSKTEIAIGGECNERAYILTMDYGGDSLNVHCMKEQARKSNFVVDTATQGASVKSRLFNIFTKVIEIAKFLHANQIYHGDLIPGNILCDVNGNNVKVIDFGLSVMIKKYESEDALRNFKFVPPDNEPDDICDHREKGELYWKDKLSKKDMYIIGKSTLYTFACFENTPLEFEMERMQLKPMRNQQRLECMKLLSSVQRLMRKYPRNDEVLRIFYLASLCIIYDNAPTVLEKLKSIPSDNLFDTLQMEIEEYKQSQCIPPK